MHMVCTYTYVELCMHECGFTQACGVHIYSDNSTDRYSHASMRAYIHICIPKYKRSQKRYKNNITPPTSVVRGLVWKVLVEPPRPSFLPPPPNFCGGEGHFHLWGELKVPPPNPIILLLSVCDLCLAPENQPYCRAGDFSVPFSVVWGFRPLGRSQPPAELLVCVPEPHCLRNRVRPAPTP